MNSKAKAGSYRVRTRREGLATLARAVSLPESDSSFSSSSATF